ncbi:hypothetical protein [Maribacter sp. 2307ULW6-5]|uniref:hypothetical protein n=1 Tax=Maribacter sp. 2307ULW6-5 TaxID=3386275 RepID=UPI0039BC92FF
MMCRFALCCLFLAAFFCHAQQDSVVAASGDGIFSILRSQGMDPIKYYVPFTELNAANIKNASELIVGKTYRLPDAPDSFKNMGREILVDTQVNKPIFKEALAKMKRKDSSLAGRVYYFLHAKGKEATANEMVDAELRTLARDLLQKGAAVYLMRNTNGPVSWDKDNLEALGNFSDWVNRFSLQHPGAAQRVIVLHDLGTATNTLSLTLGRYGEKEQETPLFQELLKTFKKSAFVKSGDKIGAYDIKDPVGVYLAKNILPPLFVLKLHPAAQKETNSVRIRSKKGKLAQVLGSGIDAAANGDRS